jgi:hypothetical protein
VKTAMNDMNMISTALMDYITDFMTAPDQDGAYSVNSEFYKALAPFYIKVLPMKDPWGNNYLVYCGSACKGKFGIPESEIYDDAFMVVCLGRDGESELFNFDPDYPENGLYLLDSIKDFNKDLIQWCGSWMRAPQESINY